jgi:SSS family solute:Na+ symporter
MYFQLTGAIYVAGAGCAIIGGLYWKRGCTIGAWAGMITGAVVSCGGLIIRAIWQDTLCPALMKMFPDWSFLANNAGEFPLDGVRISAIGMACAVSVYVGLSLWNWLVLRRQPFNMEQLLHRGKYAIAGDHAEDVVLPPTGLKTLLPTKEFSKTDKCIYYSVAIWIVASVLLLIVTTIYHFVWGTTDNWWTKYWIFKAGLVFVVSCITVVWFIVGGTKDAKHLINTLRSAKRNKLDDGRVEGYRSIADQTMGNVPSNSPEKVAQSNKAIV